MFTTNGQIISLFKSPQKNLSKDGLWIFLWAHCSIAMKSRSSKAQKQAVSHKQVISPTQAQDLPSSPTAEVTSVLNNGLNFLKRPANDSTSLRTW